MFSLCLWVKFFFSRYLIDHNPWMLSLCLWVKLRPLLQVPGLSWPLNAVFMFASKIVTFFGYLVDHDSSMLFMFVSKIVLLQVPGGEDSSIPSLCLWVKLWTSSPDTWLMMTLQCSLSSILKKLVMLKFVFVANCSQVALSSTASLSQYFPV